MHLYSQRVHRDSEPFCKSFAAVDFLGFFVPIVLGDDFTILVAETSETALQALLVVCDANPDAYRRQLNNRSLIESLPSIPPLQIFCMDQLGNAMDIPSDVIDDLTLVDSSRNPIYRFVGINIRHIRSAPLKIFQQPKTDVLILLTRLLSISVEHGEKAVERGLSENPFAFCFDLGETHVLTLLNSNNLWITLWHCAHVFLIEVMKASKHYKLCAGVRLCTKLTFVTIVLTISDAESILTLRQSTESHAWVR